MTGQFRYKLLLCKAQVGRVIRTPTGFQFSLTLPGIEPKLIISIPPHADVKEGDLLTVYTEVLTNAKPSSPNQH